MSVAATEAELALVRVVVVSILTETSKPGWKWTDLPAFLATPGFTTALQAAMAAAPQVPGELSDLGIIDEITLGKYLYGMVQQIVADLKLVRKP